MTSTAIMTDDDVKQDNKVWLKNSNENNFQYLERIKHSFPKYISSTSVSSFKRRTFFNFYYANSDDHENAEKFKGLIQNQLENAQFEIRVLKEREIERIPYCNACGGNTFKNSQNMNEFEEKEKENQKEELKNTAWRDF